MRHTVQPPGRVRRITAAVLVDDVVEKKEQEGQTTATRRKRTADEMKEIERLARAALGLEEQRGDLLAVENLSFQELPVEQPEAPSSLDRGRRMLEQWSWALRYAGVAALFLVVYFLLLRPIKKQALEAFRALPARVARSAKEMGKPAGEAAAGAATLEAANLPTGTDESKRAALLKRQLTDKVKAEPAAASRLVQTWIREASAK